MEPKERSGQAQLVYGGSVLYAIAYVAFRLYLSWRRRQGNATVGPARFVGSRWRWHDALLAVAVMASLSQLTGIGLGFAAGYLALWFGAVWLQDRPFWRRRWPRR